MPKAYLNVAFDFDALPAVAQAAQVPEDMKEPTWQLGSGIDGPMYHSLAEDPHLVVLGAGGEGKTDLLRSMITQLQQCSVWLLDLKGYLADAHSLPNVDRVVAGKWPENEKPAFRSRVEDLLADAVQQMEHRHALGRAHGPARTLRALREVMGADHTEDLRDLIVVIDECDTLIGYQAQSSRISALLYEIARKGRSAGVHLVISVRSTTSTDTRFFFPVVVQSASVCFYTHRHRELPSGLHLQGRWRKWQALWCSEGVHSRPESQVHSFTSLRTAWVQERIDEREAELTRQAKLKWAARTQEPGTL